MCAASGLEQNPVQSDVPPLLSIDAVRFAGRRLGVPFRLRVVCGGRAEEICCTEILRLLPSKRIVCRTTRWNDQPVIAKIFLQQRGARRTCRRELAGMSAFARAGIPCPTLVANATSAEGNRPVLLFEEITPAESFANLVSRHPVAADGLPELAKAVEFFAAQHQSGIVQRDPHLGNVLVRDGVLHAIDGSTVRLTPRGGPVDLTSALKNMALFLAQLPPAFDVLVPELCAIYARARGGDFPRDIARRLLGYLHANRARRVRTILKKTTRDCTDFARFVEGRLTIVCRRAYDSAAMRRVLSAPDRAIAEGLSLKDGNSATAARIDVDGRSFVIKRYNLRFDQFERAVRYLIRPSRARRSWKIAHLLEALGIDTVRPIALMERRFGPIKTTAYFVTEYISGERGEQLFRRTDLSETEAQRIAEETASLVGRLYEAGISHGDLNGRNFMYRGTVPALLDLDAATRHAATPLLRHNHLQDCRRLLRNFTESSPVYRELSRRIGKHMHGIRTKTATPLAETIRRGALKVWYRPDCPVPMTSANMLDALESSGNRGHSESGVLKIGRHRSLFRFDSGGFPLVVKAFPLDQLKDKWRWQRYALAELRNNLVANSRGIPTPACYALFRIRRRGLVDNCGVVMEKLTGYTDLATLSARDKSHLHRAIPVLASLYARGVNHIDVSPSNLFFHDQTERPVVIDWQYCTFHGPRNDVQLVMQAAHFLNYAGVAPDTAAWIHWIGDLRRGCGTSMSFAELSEIIRRVQRLKLRFRERLQADRRVLKAA